MKYSILLLCILSLAAFSVSFDAWVDYQTGGDSLLPNVGKIKIGGILEGENWNLLVSEEFVNTDSTTLFPRFITSYSQTDIDFTMALGSVVINPHLRFNLFLGDGADIVLPNAEGMASRTRYMRPGLNIETSPFDNITLQAGGMFWIGTLENEYGYEEEEDDDDDDDYDDSEDTRQKYAFGGGVMWESPLGPMFAFSGEYHSKIDAVTGATQSSASEAKDIPEWSRVDCSIIYRPENLDRWSYLTGRLKYSIYNGEDFLGNDIADRLTAGIRVSKTISPSFAVNGTFEASVDFDGEVTRFASSYGEIRAIYHFLQDRTVPSSITVSAQMSSFVTQTGRISLSSRINLYRGLSLLLKGEARETPTSVPGADDTRQRVSYGPGLEYQMGTSLRVWSTIEQQRTNLEEVEVWLRVRAGIEYYFFKE